MIRITGGASAHTFKIATEGGEEVKGITSLRLEVEPDSAAVAEIGICVSGVDVLAHPMLSLETVKAAAAFHGYALIKAQAPVDAVGL